MALSSSSNKMVMLHDGVSFYGWTSNFSTLVKIPDLDSCSSASCGSNQHCVNGNGSHWCCPLNRQGFNCEELIGCDDTFRNTMIGEWRVRKDVAPDFSSANLTYFCLSGHILLDPPVRACNVTTGLLSGHRPRCGYNFTGLYVTKHMLVIGGSFALRRDLEKLRGLDWPSATQTQPAHVPIIQTIISRFDLAGSIYMQWPETLTREQAHMQARSL